MMNSKGNAWSEKMAQSYMKSNPDLYERWSHEYGVIFKAMERLWRRTGNRMYFNYIQRNIDKNINESGKIVRGYQVEEFKVDAINSGKALFALFEITGDIRYKKVILTLADQLRIQPRTKEGVFWHKLVYPYQIFLDGFYMWAPFYAEYAEKFNESTIFDDIANQIIVAATHTRDANTGLHYQAWDEKKEIFWCNKQTGCSHSFWSRTNGWFSMAMIDVLDFFPETHVKRNKIVEIFKNQIEGLIKVQDPGTGL
jgi:unsaturated rhamnogalacturonyl hydrolase